MDLTGGLTLSRKPKIACSLEPELVFLKNVKGVSTVFNRVFVKIFRCLAEVDSDRLAAWTALVNGDVEIEVSLRPKKDLNSKLRQPRTEEKSDQQVASMKKKDDKTLLQNLVGKFDNFEPSS